MMRAASVMIMLAFVSWFSLAACNSTSDSSDPPEGGAGSVPPELVAVSPAVNDNSAVTGSPISATFDKEMNAASSGTFVVYGSQTGKLSGLYTGDGSITLIFSPDDAFKFGEEIEVILTESLTATDGASLDSPFLYRFRAETGTVDYDFDEDDKVLGQQGALGLAAGDWDDDGDLDRAVANNGGDNVTELENIP